MTALRQHVDGIEGIDLGVIGESQYALASGEVYRRKASEVGTYGGWRWECSADHPRQYASHDMPVLASLTVRIALAAKQSSVSPATGREDER
jgi:hypothetical protein